MSSMTIAETDFLVIELHWPEFEGDFFVLLTFFKHDDGTRSEMGRSVLDIEDIDKIHSLAHDPKLALGG